MAVITLPLNEYEVNKTEELRLKIFDNILAASNEEALAFMQKFGHVELVNNSYMMTKASIADYYGIQKAYFQGIMYRAIKKYSRKPVFERESCYISNHTVGLSVRLALALSLFMVCGRTVPKDSVCAEVYPALIRSDYAKEQVIHPEFDLEPEHPTRTRREGEELLFRFLTDTINTAVKSSLAEILAEGLKRSGGAGAA